MTFKGQCHLFPDKCTKTCEYCDNNTTTTPPFETTTNEITTEMPSGDCETVDCSQILDSNNNPYQCRPEKEALLWHKKCLPQNDALCRYNGKLKLMPCPFTGPKMFCADPNFFSQPKNLTAFSASSKTFVPAQKPILQKANHLFVWHKMFVTNTI